MSDEILLICLVAFCCGMSLIFGIMIGEINDNCDIKTWPAFVSQRTMNDGQLCMETILASESEFVPREHIMKCMDYISNTEAK